MALPKKQKSGSKDDTSTQQSATNDSTAKSQQDEAKALLDAAKLKEESGQCAFC